MARKAITCSTNRGGLSLKDFKTQGQALRLSTLTASLRNTDSKSFHLIRYFCSSQLPSFRPEWAFLRSNSRPSTALTTTFYRALLSLLRSFSLPHDFSFSTKAFYELLASRAFTAPILPAFWTPFLSPGFNLSRHWGLVRDYFTENYKNDLAWLITLRAVKVRNSLCNWGYTNSSTCASCPRIESIDHCFLHCPRIKLVWAFFLPLLNSLLARPFQPTCASVFFYQFPHPASRQLNFLLYFLKSILYGIWKFRNKAVFNNGKEDSPAIINYIITETKSRIKTGNHRFPIAQFRTLWIHPALCDFSNTDTLVFQFG